MSESDVMEITDTESDSGEDTNFIEIDDFGNDNKSKNRYEDAFVVLDSGDILKELMIMADDIYSLTGLPKAVCLTVGSLFQWDKEKLYNRFLEFNSQLAFLNDCHILQYISITKHDECMICFDEDDLVGFGCKHFFCSDCWNGHLKSKIENDQFLINCPYDKCLNILSEEIVQFVITDSKLFDAYLASAANSLIQISKCVKWCPGVDCGRAIRSNTPDCYGVKCSCSTSFCIKCDLENHDPLTCARLETWQKKSAEDNASKKWLNQHSKPCPSCKSPIEKNLGCNHITCRCRHEFCWVCLQNWRNHQACNVPRANTSNQLDADVDAYFHYNTRYMNHRNSLKLEQPLNEKVNRKIEQLREIYEFTAGDVKFLKDAILILSECRRVLMYSYPFAFFINPNHQKEIFENNQSHLEYHTEELSHFLENDFEVDVKEIEGWKQRVIDKSKYVDKQRIALLSHVFEGNQKQLWNYKI